MRPVHASEENDGGTGGVDATLHVQLADVNEGELARGDDVAQEGTAHGWDLQRRGNSADDILSCRTDGRYDGPGMLLS